MRDRQIIDYFAREIRNYMTSWFSTRKCVRNFDPDDAYWNLLGASESQAILMLELTTRILSHSRSNDIEAAGGGAKNEEYRP